MAQDLRRGIPEEERLPWLEEARGRPPRRRSRAGRTIGLILLLAALALFAGWRWGHRTELGGGAPGLIKAPPGPYKIKPADPGGMDVEGEGFTSFEASEGREPQGAINLSAVPEAPIARPGRTAAAPAPSDALAIPAVGGTVVQLGAFSSEAKAKAAWKGLAARFAFLTPREPVVVVAKSDTGTVYRLRTVAGAPQVAAQICGRLKVAGEACQVVAQ